ncbi:MAG: hypothetical protein JNL74_19855 [Fibrobacteres bacterium]|nr:hypothetical protein [Fibrobacterota bacterium]
MKISIVVLLLAVYSVFGAKKTARILYSGSSLGSYTTCGCPSNPTGGLPRMANFVKEQNQQFGDPLILDAGNFSSKTGRQKAVLTEYFMKGMAILKYDAVLVGGAEIETGLSEIMRFNKESKLPLISSNLVDSKGNRPFSSVIKVKNVVKGLDALIVGLTAPTQFVKTDSVAAYKILDPLETFSKISAAERKKGVAIIVLTDMKESMLEKFLQAQKGADLVIVAADYAYREMPSLVNGAQVVSSFPETRNMGVVSFDVADDSLLSFTGFNEPMASKYEKHKQMDSLFKAYDKALGGVKFKHPRPSDAQKLYAGSEACAECHRDPVAKERNGKHVKAFSILEKTGNSYNPSCLKCHVTGYERENGFWDVETSMDMAGVQCEECHGPQMAHVREERRRAFGSVDFTGMDQSKSSRQNKPYKVGFYKCAHCHTGEFKLIKTPEEAWKEIGHSK